ncbi:MAG: twin-arginine translocase TatA/TatE family subunit [Alphaproteobacteria bacterium]|jgi:sec-independent protein translocase protein TatA|nr:twin-arginine translocase TatA/TatE family subunit [Alphaproteobacteria bacterium]MDP7221805.1 twin-arginine translocase TatA/TatE family subunit [Alphaproteobacteria bacterium]
MAPGIWQILLVVLVIMLFFGAGRLPRMMEDLAKGVKSFKKGLNEEDDTSSSSVSPKEITSSADAKDDVIDVTEKETSQDKK